MAAPKVGERRVYPGHTIPVLYPGEQATSMPVSLDQILDAAIAGEEVAVADWLVEPAPGVRAWCLRWRYRLIGRWQSAFRSWWRRSRRVNAFQPGHSKLERMRALDDEMVLRKD